MPTSIIDINEKYIKSWNNLISSEKESLNISSLEMSALSSWVLDCHKSFNRIYSDLLKKIDSSDSHNKDMLHEIVSEIYFDLKHIQEHIEDADQGFLELMRVLAEK